MIAAANGHVEVVEMLIAAKADVNLQDDVSVGNRSRVHRGS